MRKWRGIGGQSTWGVAIACVSLALVAGCGSSKTGSTASTPTGAGAPTGTSSKTTPQSGVVANGKINYASPPANSPVKSGLVNISYHQISIEPDTLRVKVGSTIRWTNNDPIEHNVTSASGPVKFASKNFGEGGTFEIKASNPGVIHYRCTLHPATMNGTIEVVK